MKSLIVNSRSKILRELLTLAEHDDVVLQTVDGEQFILTRLSKAESVQIGESDELVDEIAESRRNAALMGFLETRGARAQGRRGTKLSELRQKTQAATS